MATSIERIRADDIWRILRERPAVHGYELVNGELVEVMPASWLHGEIEVRISYSIQAYLEEHPIGRVATDVGFVLQVDGDPERLRGPDVAFVSNERIEAAGGIREGWARMIPDIAVEIDSPSNEKEDVQQKVQDYLDAGVRLVWRIHARPRSATVYYPDGSARLLREEDSLDGDDVLPGLLIPLRSVFE